MKSFNKIKRLGHEKTQGILDGGALRILEKLDGNNTGFKLHKDSGGWMFRSKNVVYKEDGEPTSLDEIGGQFEDVTNWWKENVDKDKVEELERRHDAKFVFFGENMVKHSLEYNWEEVPQFLGFDIYDENSEEWLEWKDAKEIFEELDIPSVPVVDIIESASDFDPSEYEVPESRFRDGKAEGVVIRNRSNYIPEKRSSWNKYRAKLVTEEFKEKNEKAFGGRKRSVRETFEIMEDLVEEVRDAEEGKEEHGKITHAINRMKKEMRQYRETDEHDIVGKFCTDARVEKQVHKLTKEEGMDLEMSLMEKLPMRVVADILEEEEEILLSDKTINFKTLRSQVADRCVHVLKRMIREQAG